MMPGASLLLCLPGRDDVSMDVRKIATEMPGTYMRYHPETFTHAETKRIELVECL
jgi:hypothetical protein